MEFAINYLAVFIAGLSTMLVGSVWYNPKVFGNTWMKLAKIDKKQTEKGEIKPMIIAFVMSFITAFILAHFSFLAYQYYSYSFLSISLITSFLLWIGFTAVRIITHDAFEGRLWKLTILNISHELVTILVMGLIIGLFGI